MARKKDVEVVGHRRSRPTRKKAAPKRKAAAPKRKVSGPKRTRVRSSGMSNRQYHAAGKPTWWLRRTDVGRGGFVGIGHKRGDSEFDEQLTLAPGRYTLGVGPSGRYGVRHSFVVS